MRLSPLVLAALLPAAMLASACHSTPAESTTAAPQPFRLATAPYPRMQDGQPIAWTMERHKGFNAVARKGGVEVVFIGDSITQGWEGAGKAAWERDIAPFKAANFGTSGDRTENVLWRLQNGNLDGALDPKLFVVMIGSNNTGHRMDPPQDIADGVAAILHELRTRKPRAKVLLLAIFPRGEKPEDKMRANNTAANLLLAKMADGGQVRFLDLGPKLLEADGTLSKTVMPDLLHPAAAGYDRWAAAVKPEIEAMLK